MPPRTAETKFHLLSATINSATAPGGITLADGSLGLSFLDHFFEAEAYLATMSAPLLSGRRYAVALMPRVGLHTTRTHGTATSRSDQFLQGYSSVGLGLQGRVGAGIGIRGGLAATAELGIRGICGSAWSWSERTVSQFA